MTNQYIIEPTILKNPVESESQNNTSRLFKEVTLKERSHLNNTSLQNIASIEKESSIQDLNQNI